VPWRSIRPSQRPSTEPTTGTPTSSPLAPSPYASSEPTRFPAVAASSASGKLIHPWCTATPEKISVTSLGIGTHALSGTISRKTPSAPKLWMKDVTRSHYPLRGSI
jgi:hypothetical protein